MLVRSQLPCQQRRSSPLARQAASPCIVRPWNSSGLGAMSMVAQRRGIFSQHKHRAAQMEADTLLHEPAQQAQQQQESKSFTWTRAWYPVLPVDYLDATRPTPVTLLGKDLVVWRDGAGEWKCFQDACPHRLAPLSEGRIESDGTLQCSYHGWRFDSSGACTTIPQAEDAKSAAAACSNKRSCVSSYPVRQASGLLWVWPDASPLGQLESAASQPVVPSWAQQYTDAGGEIGWYMRDLPYGYETLVENLTDPAHLPFSHHKLGPNLTRDQGGSMPMRPLKDQRERTVQPLVFEEFVSYNSPESRIEFYPPGFVTYCFEVKGSDPVQTQNTHLWAVPTQPGRSRVFSTVFVTPYDPKPVTMWDVATAVASPKFKSTMMRYIFSKLPVWQRHLFSNKLFDQDGVFLAMQEQRLRSTAASKAASSSNNASSSTNGSSSNIGSGASSSTSSAEGLAAWSKEYFMPTAADRAMIQARRWIESHAGGPFGLHGSAAVALGVKQATRRQLMDRYEQHTKHCHFCKAKLKQVESTIERAPYVGAAFFCLLCGLLGSQGVQGILAGGWPAIAAVAAAVGMAVCATLHKQASGLVDQFKFVDFNHADNH